MESEFKTLLWVYCGRDNTLGMLPTLSQFRADFRQYRSGHLGLLPVEWVAHSLGFQFCVYVSACFYGQFSVSSLASFLSTFRNIQCCVALW